MKRYLLFLLPLIIILGSCNMIHKSQEKKHLRTIDNCLAGTVTVVVKKEKSLGNVIMGFRGEKSEKAYEKSLKLTGHLGAGSGFIIRENDELYVITNAHVIENASKDDSSIFVYGFNREEFEVELVGGDSWLDIAVLRFKNQPTEDIETLSFSDKNPKLGEQVYAIGTPLGTHPNSVTDGIISGLNRTTNGLTGKYGYLQHTATVIWGNSGGPLVNRSGQVVGLNTSIHFANGPDGNKYLQQQMNFALASEIAKKTVSEIIKEGKRKRVHLGIELTYSQEIINSFNEGEIYLGEVLTPFPMITHTFDTRGGRILRQYVGWYVKEINGIKVNDLESALGMLELLSPEENVELLLMNQNGEEELKTVKPEVTSGDYNRIIAEHVLSETFNLSVLSNSAQLKVKVNEEKSFDAYIVAAGTVDEYQTNVYRITTVEDLGGVLRIYGLEGSLSLMMSLDGSTGEFDVVSLTEFFDNDQIQSAISKDSKLWY